LDYAVPDFASYVYSPEGTLSWSNASGIGLDPEVFSMVVARPADGSTSWARDIRLSPGAISRAAYLIPLGVDGSGDLYSAAAYIGSIDLGGGALPAPVSGPAVYDENLFLARFSAADGHHVFSKALKAAPYLGPAAELTPLALKTDEGALYLLARAQGLVDFGFGQIVINPVQAMLVIFDHAGNFLALRAPGPSSIGWNQMSVAPGALWFASQSSYVSKLPK
jgi:hypothetical protein